MFASIRFWGALFSNTTHFLSWMLSSHQLTLVSWWEKSGKPSDNQGVDKWYARPPLYWFLRTSVFVCSLEVQGFLRKLQGMTIIRGFLVEETVVVTSHWWTEHSTNSFVNIPLTACWPWSNPPIRAILSRFVVNKRPEPWRWWGSWQRHGADGV